MTRQEHLDQANRIARTHADFSRKGDRETCVILTRCMRRHLDQAAALEAIENSGLNASEASGSEVVR